MFEKLGKNPEFQKVYKQGRSKANKYLAYKIVTWIPLVSKFSEKILVFEKA